MTPHGDLRGAAAERYVAGRLAREGYRILEANYRARPGEIDLIALDGDVLVFIEVRQRTGDRFGSAEESVDSRKLRRILDTAGIYVAAHPELADHIWRLDLVAITLDRRGTIRRYRHIENVSVD
jgi:putative endonuclease